MLTFRQITLSQGQKILIEESSAALHEKQKIGLIGRNGCGKSTFFQLILKNHPLDAGEIQIHPHLRMSHLAQEIPDTPLSALAFVLSGDEEYWALQQQLLKAEVENDDALVLSCHDRLSQTDGYSKPAQAAIILAGLGFSTEEQHKGVNQFSGGWRMRLNLARCLMKPAELLLLDEPTNHLDMEAIFWLERWLKQSPASVIVISHDRMFLDAFVTHILHIEQKSLNLYSGNYTQFEAIRAQKLALQQALYEKQQKKITHMMSFVQRFKAKATKAKQAQSRLKAIEKMDVVMQAHMDSPFSFQFLPCPRAGKPLIRCDQMTVGYGTHPPILKQVNLLLNPGDRIALLGPNGEGKSTLIKTLTGALTPFSGTIERSTHLNIGYYAQHQLEELEDELSPIQTLQKLTKDATEQALRDYLGGFDFKGDMAAHSIRHFSGGEKARLALAKLVWLKPNLLLLDEPTNHLDLDMRAAIEIALQNYEGAMILISHDRHLLQTAVDDFYLVYGGKVQPFQGDIEDYDQWIKDKDSPTLKKISGVLPPKREKKTLQNRVKKLDEMLCIQQEEMQKIELQLSLPELYEPHQQASLQKFLTQRDQLQNKIFATEDEWLQVMGELDES